MRLSVCDRRGAATATVDVVLDPVPADATVADLLTALADHLPGRVAGEQAGVVTVDGWPVEAGMRIVDLALRAGSVLTLGARAAVPQRELGPVARLTQLAGAYTGASVALRPGTFVIGRGGPGGLDFGPVSRPVLRITVDDTAAASVTPIDDDEVRLNGVTMPEEAGHTTNVVAVGDSVFRLSVVLPGFDEPPVGADPDPYGRMPLIRTPRVTLPTPSDDVLVPDPPAPVPAPQPPSWLMMLAPLPIGIVLAFVLSPFFLIMIAMTPLMGLARWIEGKYRGRKERARVARELAAAAERFAEDLDRTRADVAAAARAAHNDLAELGRRARSGRGLWEVRPGDPDELRVSVGFGTLPWRPEMGRSADGLRSMPDLVPILTERSELVDVPIPVDLRQRTGLGVVGPDARALAAAVVVDLVTRHGPADLGLALLVEEGRLAAWDWAKWLPHLSTGDGAPRLATDAESAVTLLTNLVEADRPAEPGRTGGSARNASVPAIQPERIMVVVDGDGLLTGRLASLLGRYARGRGRAIVVGGGRDRLPSVCQNLVDVDASGTATVTDAVTGGLTRGVVPVRATPGVCVTTARLLAGWTDPEQAGAAAVLPSQVRLVDLLGEDSTASAEIDDATIAAWWRRPPPGLTATIGVTETGPFTVDLLADGPHALVVGTTGAGKSELLRTLVASLACRYPPDLLAFLLVDFKGGGAFDACAGLPHTVGIVTDLDEHLAARALRCLQAELRHRERRLREAGVSDLRDLIAPDPPLPRLAIVIDEFATLAAELPGFLSALVDVAQRGRSLGIHLVLATQRPQGVVDGKIRANTNLRVALRVQDDASSQDVLGTRQAVDIDRRRPGRAYARLGAGEIVAVQTALVTGAGGAVAAQRIGISPFSLAPKLVPVAAPAGDEPPPDESADIDLTLIRAATRAAATAGGYRPPRVPWPPPLPADLDAWALPDRPRGPGQETGPDPAPLAVVDLPDEQRAAVWWWRPEAGGTLLLGADAATTQAAVASACLALARCRPPDQQTMFVLNGYGASLAGLAGLPHMAAVVAVDDAERLSRVLDRLDAEVTLRRSSVRSGPEVLVAIANWSAVIEGAERAGIADAPQRLERLLRDGASVGVRLLAAAPHERAVPGRVFAQLPTKVCLRLADPSSYVALGLRAREVPELRGLRAIDLTTRQELQIGRYADLPAAVARIAGKYPDAAATPDLDVLPEVVPVGEVTGASTVVGASWRLGIGQYYRDLRPAVLTLTPGVHAVVAGPPGSGRTTALRAIAAAARASAPDVGVCVVAPDPREWVTADVTEVVATFEELTCWPTTGRGLLLVDGLEAIGPSAGPSLDRLLPAVPVGGHVVVAGRPDAFRGMQTWQRMLTLARTGLLLRPTLDDGDILRVRLPREARIRPLPGRGYLVVAGEPDQVQVASDVAEPMTIGGTR